MGFTLLAGSDGVQLEIQRVWSFPDPIAYPGGYSTETIVNIWSGNFRASATVSITTGELYGFYEELKQAYSNLSGSAHLPCFDGDFELTLSFQERGRFLVTGELGERTGRNNRLIFEMEADQSYLVSTISELSVIVDRYGDNKGKRPS